MPITWTLAQQVMPTTAQPPAAQANQTAPPSNQQQNENTTTGLLPPIPGPSGIPMEAVYIIIILAVIVVVGYWHYSHSCKNKILVQAIMRRKRLLS